MRNYPTSNRAAFVLLRTFRMTGSVTLLLLLTLSFPCILPASEHLSNHTTALSPGDRPLPAAPWYENIDAGWGGHFRVFGDASWPDEKSVFKLVGPDTYFNGAVDLRLKNRTYLFQRGYAEIHYENILSGGDFRQALGDLERRLPGFDELNLLLVSPINDDRRLMDLTKTISQGDDYIWYHRLDRLSLTLLPAWGTVSVGRQALTWGNGLIFNPMDLFNPFQPADIIRDYKVGDDMAFVQLPLETIGDAQFAYVARRNPTTDDLESNRSTLTGKLHFAAGDTEFDIMAAAHYGDTVMGLGSRGYLRSAAWRLDATYTFLDDTTGRNGFLSLVANMDYSWVWKGKNWHGFVEFYFNGLGDNDYPEAIADPDIFARLARGDLFVLGRTYLSGEIRMELHPLLNLFFTAINNTADPSGILQPRAVWDVTENTQITAGANLSYGESGSEYGGFKLLNSNNYFIPSNSVVLWMSYFF